MNTLEHPSYEMQPQKRGVLHSIRSLGTTGMVGGLLFLLVTVAGIATALQLLQNSQENRSSAALDFATVSLQAAETELKPNTATNAYVSIQPAGNAVSAVDVPIKYDPEFVTISNFAVVPDVLPTELLPVSNNATTGMLRFVSGISKITNNTQVGLPITENKQIASFTIKTKNKTGATDISIDGNALQVAAYDKEANVGQAGSKISLSVATQQAVCDQTCSTADECQNDAGNLTCSAAGRCVRKDTGTCQAQVACAVTLTSPANGTSIERNDALTWNACAQALNYEVIVEGGELNYIVKELPTKEFVIPAAVTLNPGTTYTWRVRACLNADCSSAGTWSPDSTFTVKEAPAPDPATPQLKLNFNQQGLRKAGVTLPVDLTIVYGNNQKLQDTVNFTSASGGTLTTASPIVLEGISLTGGATTQATVYVRTETSLVTNVGTVTLKGGETATLTAASDRLVLIGDYVREGNNANVIKLVDIALPISKYTTISAPVTDETRKFDTNYDGIFSILDISLVMSNLEKLEYRGDQP